MCCDLEISFGVSLDYVEDIYKVMVEGIETDALTAATAELSGLAPPPMNTMLEKQSRTEAIAKHVARNEMVTEEVPCTNEPGSKSLVFIAI